MIEVIDNVLEEHIAILIDDYVKNLSWKYDYESKRGQPNKHWHVLCGHNKEECDENGFDWVTWIFEYVGNRLVIFDAHLPHKAMPVSRECYELRTNVVFKCNV